LVRELLQGESMKKRKRTRIVPAVVFSAVVGAAVVPQLAGCNDSKGPLLTVAATCFTTPEGCRDLGIGVAADFAIVDGGRVDG
jgi:hypothetical protein